ncbi:MAG: hypothetical protein ACMXYG_02915 [Candidatus Woesearchaeota archaeon]
MLKERFQLSREFTYWFYQEAFGPGIVSLDKNCLVVTSEICDLLKSNHLNPKTILARGGFNSQEDISLILQTGWDYENRDGLSKREESTYALPIEEMDTIHRFDDPANNSLFWIRQAIDNNKFPALVLYDLNQMRLSGNSRYAQAKVYNFLYPHKKRDALIGIIEIDVV